MLASLDQGPADAIGSSPGARFKCRGHEPSLPRIEYLAVHGALCSQICSIKFSHPCGGSAAGRPSIVGALHALSTCVGKANHGADKGKGCRASRAARQQLQVPAARPEH